MSFDFAGECAAKYHKKVYLSDFELTWHMLQPHVIFETFIAQGMGNSWLDSVSGATMD
jgi:hypothetical protein